MSLVCPSCPWLVLAPKVLQPCTNHLVLVLCKSMWVSKACHFFLVPSRSSSTPLYPSIMLRARECALTPCASTIFNLGFTFESLKELGVRHQKCFNYALTTLCWFYAGSYEWLKLVNLPSPIPELQHTLLPLYSVTNQGAWRTRNSLKDSNVRPKLKTVKG
jgi:hypothetical protein